jgi:hypothetical protein
MATLQETLDAVTEEDGRVDSIIAFLDGIKKQLDDVLSGTTLPPAVQSAFDAVFASAKASSGKIDAALNTNVPPPTP